ncbi:MAG: GDP-fucose synthetase [Crocinitomicaceae bacterium]|nr:GDP-fucose synthetase [Crocinitomicaceae bacterium]|tara:strand:+ start:621 stop:1556 length:936 start_codon:yes stop_codon:yes gene_type:complete
MLPNDKIYVAGHNGMVGSAIVRKLSSQGYNNVIVKNSSELDLRNQHQVRLFFEKNRPSYVFLAAAKVGGIIANNSFKADFIYDNLMIQTNVLNSSHQTGVDKVLFLGSSCIYPKFARQPISESELLSGSLESTNDAYAIAKIAGIKMCQSYREQHGFNCISVMPTNLYGPNDNYDLKNSHVLPALIRKFHEAKINKLPSVEVWGSGNPKREFLHVDDLADACLFLMNKYNSSEIINVGTGQDLSINELALLIKKVTGYKGEISYNTNKPDGTPRKLLDVSKLQALGWEHKINLLKGVNSVYEEYSKLYKAQ